MGMIYKRGNIWWIKYYRNGKPLRESTKSKKEADAKRLLKKREGEISEGKIPGIYFDKVRFDELASELIMDYKINGRKSLERVEIGIRVHLKPFFGDIRVPDITTPRIQKYIKYRMEEGAANATINRELAALKRMLNLGAKQTPPKVNRVPHIPMLRENNTRKGFFEPSEYEALMKVLPHHLNALTTFAYKTGWRLSEITNLKWDQVDLKENAVRLEGDVTKNQEARTVYLDDELQELISDLYINQQIGCPYVFNRDGRQITYTNKAWRAACKKAGLRGKLFHDLRRTAVRNMVRAGIPEGVAMKISGHKTKAVFERYNIVSPDDLKEAARKLQVHLEN